MECAAPTRGQYRARVIANTSLCREHYRLTLWIEGFPTSAPGQFVQLQCRDTSVEAVDHEFDWSPDERPTIDGGEFRGVDAFLRRPFSIAGRRDRTDGSAEIDIIGREIGPGTRFLARLNAGDELSIVGPLGNGFTLLDEGAALLVGGGVGIPPMIYAAQALRDREEAVRTMAFAGATTRDLLPLTVEREMQGPPGAGTGPGSSIFNGIGPLFEVSEFARNIVPVWLTTDDGTLGTRGYVTDALERYLDLHQFGTRDDLPSRTTIYTCGPELMMKRVQQIAEARGIRCQIAVERAMACGMGTCQSCCIRIKKPDAALPPLPGKSWCYRLACTDGPVFSGADLLW